MSGIEIGKTAASAGAWAWKLLENPFTDFLKRRWEDAKSDSEKAQYLQVRWNEFDWGKAAERYKERMKANYGHIRVLGSTEPKSLDDLFTDVNILEKPLAFRRFDITQLHELQKEPAKLYITKRFRGLDVVADKDRGHRLYILGQPGAGKTTFLKYIVHQAILEGVDKIPIFVTIKDWADSGKSILDFIYHQFNTCQFPNAIPFIEYILFTGKAVALFDGLDEVKQEDNLRARITTDLHDFSKKYSETQTIVTCRVAASDYSFTEFTYVEISDFTDGQIDVYARKWFGKEIQKSSQFLEELKKPDNKGVRDLSRSPLLLSLICLAYDETLQIPQRRVELYEEALDALLKKWDASRNIHRDEIKHPGQAETYKKLSLGRKRQMFSRIAAEAFEKGEIFFHKKKLAFQIKSYFKNLPPVDASEEIDGEVILRAIESQHGILTERAQGIYSFSHLTFQEYYTAKYIVDNSPHTWDGLINHIYDNRWREVFLLTASLPNEADILVERMQKLSESFIKGDKTIMEICDWAIRKANKINSGHNVALKSSYWYLMLDCERGATFSLSKSKALSLGYTLTSSLADAISKTITYKPNLPIELLRARSYALSLLLDINMGGERIEGLKAAQERSKDRSTARDTALLLGKDILQFAIKQDANDIPLSFRNNAYNLLLDALLIFVPLFLEIFGLVGEFKEVRVLYPKLSTFFDEIYLISKECDSSFYKSFVRLPLPKATADKSTWIKYEQDLRTLLIQHRDIGHSWKLTDEQFDKIKKIILINKLLLDCLEVAYVRDREAILSKILTVDPETS